MAYFARSPVSVSSVCLSVCLCACLPVLTACLPVCSACLPVCLSVLSCSVYLSACLSVCLPACLPACLFCLSAWLPRLSDLTVCLCALCFALHCVSQLPLI
jgi:hypothetical protein